MGVVIELWGVVVRDLFSAALVHDGIDILMGGEQIPQQAECLQYHVGRRVTQ